MKHSPAHRGRQLYSRLLLSSILTAVSGQTLANPTGAQIVNGSVQINAIANQLNIHNSNGAIINWQDFSIGQQEITRFIQQNSTSAVLNRVVGQNPSAIMGQLLSNGHVFLINPNGVVFGANAVVDTAGLVASSLNMSDESFLSGKYKFSGDASNGAVINRGLITAGKGGEIVLIAPTVENHGVISVEGGRILLAAGQKMTLSSMDLEGIEFEVQAPINTAMNLGKLLASGGSVGVFAGSLTNTGVINANSVTKGKDGKLWLEASSTATVGGKLAAPDITIAGSDISLKGADISASNEAGGGQIRIGGDYQGAALGPNVSNAKSVTIDAATTISANALTQGDGGRVIVWSDENTVVNGHISATGGSQSGNGGFVETSGKKVLDFTTPVDVSATNGKAGTWLIDPEDITIDESKASSIETALNEGSNVEVKTSDTGEGEGNITVAAAITKTDGGDATLSLDAHNKIDVNAPITSTSNKLDVKLTAGNQINVNSSITTNGGSVSTLITGTSTTTDTPADPTADSSTETPADPTTETVVEPVPDETAVPEETTEASTDTPPTETVVIVEEAVADLNTSIAGSIETSGGDISINAGEAGSVLVEGTLDASNYEVGAIGGNIEVLGDQVELAGDALLDASGDAGGGTIKVGGDYQGQGDTPTATNTTVGEGVLIKADAVTEGDGGTVIVWSDDTTVFHGSISATGGEQGGDGGFAEVSGKQHAYVTGHADLRAPNGEVGTFLLDPGTINIVAGTASGPDTIGATYVVNQLAISDFTIATSNVGQADNVGPNDINVNADIVWGSVVTPGIANTLTLDAGNDINIYEDIRTFLGDGGLNLIAGGDVLISPGTDFQWVFVSALTIDATNLYISAVDDVSVSVSTTTTDVNLAGDFTIQAAATYGDTATMGSSSDTTISLDGKLSVLGGVGDDAWAYLGAGGDFVVQGLTSARAGGIDIIGGSGQPSDNDGSYAQIYSYGKIDLKTTDLLVKGDGSEALVSSYSGSQDIDASGLISLQGGGSTGASAMLEVGGNGEVGDNLDRHQSITAGSLELIAGTGTDADAIIRNQTFVFIGNNANASQTITAGSIDITGGDSTTAGIYLTARTSDVIQHQQITADSLTMKVIAGGSGEAVIWADSTVNSHSQTVQLTGDLLMSGPGVIAIFNAGDGTSRADQTISATNISLLPESQVVTSSQGMGFLNFSGNQFITARGSMVIDSGTSVNGDVEIVADDNQIINVTNQLSIKSGSNGTNNEIYIYTNYGQSSITASSILIDGQGGEGYTWISGEGTTITSTTGDILINNGDVDINNGLGLLTIDSAGQLIATSGSGSFQFSSSGDVALSSVGDMTFSGDFWGRAYGTSMTLDVGGNLSLLGSSDPASSDAYVYLAGDVTLTANVAGSTLLQGGAQATCESGFCGVEMVASAGALTLNSTGGVDLIGGSGPDAYALLDAGTTMTIDTQGSFNLTGGSGNGAYAVVQSQETMTINSMGSVLLTAGSGVGADAGVAGAISGTNTVFLDIGQEGVISDLTFTDTANANAYIQDGLGNGIVNIALTGCYPAGSCALLINGGEVDAAVLNMTYYNALGIPVPATVVGTTPGTLPVPVITTPTLVIDPDIPVYLLEGNITQLTVAMILDAFSQWVNDPTNLSDNFVLLGAMNDDNGDRASGGQKVYIAEWLGDDKAEGFAPKSCN